MVALSIRRGERGLTAALAGYFFLVLAALYLIKPASKSLFLEGLGADWLPYVYIATALVTWWAIVPYLRVAPRFRLLGIIQVTLAATLVSLVGFWWWLSPASVVLLPVFYVWVKFYGILLPSQLWLLSDEYMDPRQAKRLFAPIGAGGILGSIVGSAAARALANPLGTRSLLAIAAALVVGAWGILWALKQHAPPARPGRLGRWSDADGELEFLAWQEERDAGAEEPPPPQAGGAATARPGTRSLILLIVTILILATTAHTIIDWQFNKAVELQITDTDARTTFFGGFFMVLNLVTLGIQLLATSFILRYFGIGVALALLPVALATGAVGILLHPGLWTTVFARGADDALRYSTDQSGRELLFLPIPSSDRQRLKPRIDLIANRAGNGVGGLLILGAIAWLPDPLRYLSVASLALVAVWLAALVRTRRNYAESLQLLLRVRDLDVAHLAKSRLDANALGAIRDGLQSSDPDTVHAALDLAAHTDPTAFVPELRELLRVSEDAELKGEALRLLTEARDESSLDEAMANIDQADQDLTAEALAYACAMGDPKAQARVDAYLAGDDPLLAATAAVCLLEHSDRDQQEKGVEILEQAVSVTTQQVVELRVAIADIIRRRPEMELLRPLLKRLLADEAPQVVRAALWAGTQHQDPDLVPPIATAGLRRTLHTPALQALQVMGAVAVGPLTGILADPRNGRELRQFVARALGRLGGSAAAEGLIAGIVADDRPVRWATLKALNHMRRRGEKLHIGPERQAAAIRIEWNDYLSLHRLAAALQAPGTDTPTAFVAAVVEERLHEAEERLFRALALRHPIQAVFFAYRGLITEEPAARGHAIELIDSIVETPERRSLVRLLEEENRAARGRIAAAELGRSVPGTDEALRELLNPADPWLAACAIRALDAEAGSISDGLRADLLAHRYAPLAELLA